MAVLNKDAKIRLFVRLLYNCDLVNDTSTTDGNHTDAAGQIAKTVLDLAEYLDIHCVPGNEWEMLHDLRRHCQLIDTLLPAKYLEHEMIRQEIHVLLERYCYLLEFESIRLAALIETMCLRPEGRSRDQ